MKTNFLAKLLFVSSMLSLSSSLLAAPPRGQQPGGHLRITEVFVDFSSDTITITGEDFDFGGPLEITLGEVGDISADCTELDAQTISCNLSASGIPADGDYLLTVATGAGQSQLTSTI